MHDSFRFFPSLFSEARSPLDSHDDAAAPEPPREPQSWIQFVFWGPNGLRTGWRLLIFILILSVLSGALFLALRPFAHPRVAPANLSPSVEVMLPAEFLSALVVFLATYLMTKIEGRTFADYGLPWRKLFNVRFWEGMAWGFAGMTALLVALHAGGCFSFGTFALRGVEFARYAAAWGVMFLFVGFFEEMLLRGYALFTLTTGIGFWPSAVVLSAAFGGIHIFNPGETPVGVTGAGLFGLVMCLTLRRTGDLRLAIGFHAAWDWGETFFYGVPDSGLVAPGHFLNSSFHGPNWLTGGSVGPEASVLTPVVLTAFWLVFSRRFPAVRYPNPASLGDPRPRS